MCYFWYYWTVGVRLLKKYHFWYFWTFGVYFYKNSTFGTFGLLVSISYKNGTFDTFGLLVSFNICVIDQKSKSTKSTISIEVNTKSPKVPKVLLFWIKNQESKSLAGI